jgi:hypothetical protein
MQMSSLNYNNNTKTLTNTVDLINPQNQDPILITTNSSNTSTYAENNLSDVGITVKTYKF